MPAKNTDLHGNVPENASVVLLLIDVINAMDFEGSEALVAQAEPIAPRIAELKRRAADAGVPAVYVNDNFGRWKSDLNAVVEHCLNDGVPGENIARQLVPEACDYVVLKPKHSAFYATTLDVLLQYLGARTLILTGVAGNICILFSASDAYMRDYHIVVPSDCIASNTKEENDHALEQITSVLKADTRPSAEIDFAKLRKRAASSGA